MKSFLAGIFALFSLTVFGLPTAKGLEHLSIAGSEYVRLADWAASTGFKIKWIKKNEQLEVRSPSLRLDFTVDSRKSEIGAVTIMLSLPMVVRNGTPLISLTDVESTIQPILFPQKNPKQHLKIICLDPGHGGKDTGKIDKKNLEKKYTLLLAQEVAALLQKNGFKVILTRNSDQTLELSDRAFIARRNSADLFVSLHYNAAGTPDVRGVEVYCLTPPGFNSSNDGGGKSDRHAYAGNVNNDHNVMLGYQMLKTIIRALPIEDRGLKRSRFEVLREARMPAILIEGGFMTSPLDSRLVYDATFRKRMAQAVVDGIISYRKLTEGSDEKLQIPTSKHQ